ncbi:MAG: CNNM domain-containing protein, partial [Chloroflexi bacterium]|nr:CNNM domain-containing protein [Chloroflexota bacterium]
MTFPLQELLVIVLLTLLQGFFVAAEIALVSVRRSRIEQLVEEGNRGARRVRKLLDDPGRFLAVIQLSLTFLGFFASAFTAVSLAGNLSTFLVDLGVGASTAAGLALVVVTVLLSLFTIVFAELVPKTFALAWAERFALAQARPIELLGRLLSPIVALLTSITRGVSRIFGAEVNTEAQITAEELRLIVERGGEQGILEAEEEQMINAVIELGDRRVHEVMIPRVAIAGLSV